MKKLILFALLCLLLPAKALADVKVYYDNTSTNWSTVKVHYWGSHNTNWHGEDMTNEGGGLWSITLQGTPNGMVINDGVGDPSKSGYNQTTDLTEIKADHVYYMTYGDTSGSCTTTPIADWIAAHETTEPDPVTTITVYYDNTLTKWSAVNIHYWSSPSTSWPGTAMTDMGNGLWCYTFTDKPNDGMLFNNTSGGHKGEDQTANIVSADIVDGTVYKMEPGAYEGAVTSMSLEAWLEAQTSNPDPQPGFDYPTLYITGLNYGSWWFVDEYKMTREGNVYTYVFENGISGEWKIGGGDWSTYVIGPAYGQPENNVSIAVANTEANFQINSTSRTVVTLNLDTENSSASDPHGTLLISIESGNTDPDPQPTTITVYYDNTQTNWDAVNIHYWSIPSTGWPGTAMTDEGNGLWSYTFTEKPNVGMLFNDTTGVGNPGETQTKDINSADIVDGTVYTMAYGASGGAVTTMPLQEWLDTPHTTPDPEPGVDPTLQASGTLPILYINIYKTDADGAYLTDGEGNRILDPAVIDKDLADKDYRKGEYWLDVNGCQWLIDLGAESVGSKDKPLDLEMKARGNYTRTGFSKKPFKLKLGKKQSLLGMTPAKSKHWAILAHADDTYGYLRNFVGFDLGKRIGLPWTPSQQPVEVIINGDYRGLYFLTEGIRVGDGRVDIAELADNATDPAQISGGYLVELDNYDDENQISMQEKIAPGANVGWADMLRVTFNTPEKYSDVQRRFVTEQFTKMNDYIGAKSDELWRYMDLDDAARYYVVEEIVSHPESYHGSTYLFRDNGEGCKWHFSPLWDFGNAFAGATDRYLYEPGNTMFGNTWIPSLCVNPTFMAKVKDTWKWFMTNCYDGLMSDIDAYVEHIREAAKADRKRWAGASLPSSNGNNNPTAVVDNSDMSARKSAVVNHLNAKISWLNDGSRFGVFNDGGTYTEPERDTTEAAPLPNYCDPDYVPKKLYVCNDAGWDGINTYMYVDGYGHIAGWPGIELTQEMFHPDLYYTDADDVDHKGLYVFEIPDDMLGGMIIFSEKNGSRRYPGDGDPGMAMGNGDIFYSTSWQKVVSNPEIHREFSTSGTLPILSIETADKAEIGFGDEGIVSATFSFDPLDTEYAAFSGLTGSIKGRDLDLWTNIAKKNYKIKLDTKTAVMGMNKSKHFVLMAYTGDAANGLLSNYAAHELSSLLNMAWTPSIQPVEVMLNGHYLGLYFIGENVRPDSKRVNIKASDDKGYSADNDWLIEINHRAIDAETAYSWSENDLTHKVIAQSPEITDAAFNAEILRGHIENIISTVNTASTEQTKAWMDVIDLDQAARFYIVQELMDCLNAYSESLYMYHTSGSKWCFGPVWNFDSSFASGKKKKNLIHDNTDFAGGSFIEKLWANDYFRLFTQMTFVKFVKGEIPTFQDSAAESAPRRAESAYPTADMFDPQLNGLFSDLFPKIDEMSEKIDGAVSADAERWPEYAATSDSSSLTKRKENLKTKLLNNASYLETSSDAGGAGWNSKDITTGIEGIVADRTADTDGRAIEYYDITGRRVARPIPGTLYIVRLGDMVTKAIFR